MTSLLNKVRQGAPLDDTLIIDAHAHLGSTYNFFIPWNDATGMVEVMDSLGVNQACISAHLAIGPDFRRGNQLVLEAIEQYPDRFLGYLTINPTYPEEITQELKEYFQKPNFVGIKLHPELQHFTVDDKRCIPIWEFAAEKGLPILSHTWDNRESLERLSADYPEINFIVAHASYLFAFGGEEYVDLVRERDNIYLDIASSYVYFGVIKEMVSLVGADKILFGTDFPFFDATVQFGNLLWSDISDEDKRKILGQNFKRLIK